MKILVACCITLAAAGAAYAKTPVGQQACVARCVQEMKACYRINDVITIDHCDTEYKQCLLGCVRKMLSAPD